MNWNSPYLPYGQQVASSYGIPWDVFNNVVGAESSWSLPNIGQFIPSTAAQYNVNTSDPYSGLNGVGQFLSDLHNQFGNWTDAVAAYNAGPNADLANWTPPNSAYASAYSAAQQADSAAASNGAGSSDTTGMSPATAYASQPYSLPFGLGTLAYDTGAAAAGAAQPITNYVANPTQLIPEAITNGFDAITSGVGAAVSNTVNGIEDWLGRGFAIIIGLVVVVIGFFMLARHSETYQSVKGAALKAMT